MYPEKYIDYLVHFHGDRDYFECHEVLEEYWKTVDKNNKDSILVGFILLAVSNYHHRRKNFNGAIRTLEKSIKIFERQQTQLKMFGFSHNVLIPFLQKRLVFLKDGGSYQSINLPIEDPLLIDQCKLVCINKGITWGNKSDLRNEEIVHRHLLRDRSEVILERNQAINLRQKKGSE